MNATLADELVAGRVLVHPFVIGELACGNLKSRREVLRLLAAAALAAPARLWTRDRRLAAVATELNLAYE